MARVLVHEGPVLRGDSRDKIATQVERHISKAEGERRAGDRVVPVPSCRSGASSAD
jgi:hypothetical protein